MSTVYLNVYVTIWVSIKLQCTFQHFWCNMYGKTIMHDNKKWPKWKNKQSTITFQKMTKQCRLFPLCLKQNTCISNRAALKYRTGTCLFKTCITWKFLLIIWIITPSIFRKLKTMY